MTLSLGANVTAIFREQLELHLLSAFQDSCNALTHFSPKLHTHWQEITSASLYPLEAGGKRVRPIIVGLLAEACGASIEHEAVLKAACAVELIHTYSLVHDDLPCMDNDDFRRGQPTTHKVFGEANALLVGDALLTHAFTLLSELRSNDVPAEKVLMCVNVLSNCSGPQGMIAGQWLDLSFEKSNQNADWECLQAIHTLKTGALLAASFSIGLIIGLGLSRSTELRKLSVEKVQELAQLTHAIGIKVGLIFQIIDDILDATKSSHELGKTAGKDSAQDKLTSVKLLGVAGSTSKAAELTHHCLNELEILQTKISTESLQQIDSTGFKPLRHFITELLSRTS